MTNHDWKPVTPIDPEKPTKARYRILPESEARLCRCGANAMATDWGSNKITVRCANRDELCDYGRPAVTAPTLDEALAIWGKE